MPTFNSNIFFFFFLDKTLIIIELLLCLLACLGLQYASFTINNNNCSTAAIILHYQFSIICRFAMMECKNIVLLFVTAFFAGMQSYGHGIVYT